MENEIPIKPIGIQHVMERLTDGENGACFRPKHELLANNAATKARFVIKN